MGEEPTAPESIPQYVRDGIDRQGRDVLEEIVRYCESRLEYLAVEESGELEERELAESDEQLVEVDEASDGTRVIKRVPCGKNCDGCPHGPYLYLVTRDGDSVNWDYRGRYYEDSEGGRLR